MARRKNKKSSVKDGEIVGIVKPKSSRLNVGKTDSRKRRLAKTTMLAGGMNREAGMMIDGISNTNTSYAPGFVLESYRNSYASGLGYKSGIYDIPTFVTLMNTKNGGILQWPSSLQERYSWFRWYARCFTDPNTPITRDDGSESPLVSFKKGDKVINAIGGITEVSEVFSQTYTGEVFTIKAEGNLYKNLEVTPEHPFWVVTKEKILRHKNRQILWNGKKGRQTNVEIDFSPEWIQAKDLKIGDCMIVPKVCSSDENAISVERARLAGYYLSEGNLRWKKGKPVSVVFSLGSHEKDLIEEISSLCKRETGKDLKIYWYKSRPTGVCLCIYDRELASWMNENCGTFSRGKKLSDNLFRANAEIAKNILATWVNGDGTISYQSEGEISGITVSPVLANQLYLMATRIGIAASKIEIETSLFSVYQKSGDIGWKIIFPPYEANKLIEYTKFEIPTQKSFRWKKFNKNGNTLLPIRDIEKRNYDGRIWNISTNGKTENEKSFLAYGMATHNSEPLVSRALDLLSDLPMSKLSLHVPKFVPEAMREEVKEFFEEQARTLNLFKVGEDILYERNMIGNVFVWSEWDEENKKWSRIQMLPPEEVFPFEIPFSDLKRIEYRPRRLVSMLLGNTGSGVNNEIDQDIVDNVPQEIVEAIQTDGCILLESDPMKGSFCQHIPRRKSPYLDISASLLDRVLVPLQLKDFYKFTQLSLASRNMTPKYLVIAPDCTPSELDDLRNQWDLSYLDPDYAMVANFEVRVEVIGSKDRLLDLAAEYERLDNEIFAAMGVTRELLTGEGSYSGSKITVEILHTMFLHERETLVNFFEQKLFLPICEKKGWYTLGKNNIKKYWYPKVGFNRLTIRDNNEVFESLFQMYQKGSLPVEIIYDLFNLDTTEIDDKLYADLFTIRDATFNELIRGVFSDAGRGLAENSDIVDKIAKYLKLKYQKQQEGGDGGGSMPPPQEGQPETPSLETMLAPALQGETGTPAENTPKESAPQKETSFDTSNIGEKAQEIADELPSSATPEEIIQKIVSKEKTWDTLSTADQNAISDMIIKTLPPNATEDEIMKAIILKTGGIL